MDSSNSVFPAIRIPADLLGLVNAAVAIVHKNESHKYLRRQGDDLDQIEQALKCDINVYDSKKRRMISFIFADAVLEVEVGGQPEVQRAPDGPHNDPDGTTTGPSEPPKLAMAA